MKVRTTTPDVCPRRIPTGTSVRHVILLVTLCFALYANSLSNKFVWDDNMQVVRNAGIRSIGALPQAFSTEVWSFMGQPMSTNYYRPFQTIAYIVAYRVGGLSPVVYHLTSVILHSAVTILVYFLCIELGWAVRYALIAGAIFASHPVHTEAVAWIAAVPDLLCALFYVASLYLFLRHQNSKSGWPDKNILLSAACFLAALFSKEMAITLPLVVCAIFAAQETGARFRLKNAALFVVPYTGALIVYLAFRVAAIGTKLPAISSVQASLVDWSSLALWAVGQYLRYSILPYPLYLYHPAPVPLAYRLMATTASAAIALAVFLLVWVNRRREPAAMLWFTIFMLTLIPVLYFRAISSGFFSERYLYTPSVPIIVLSLYVLKQLDVKRAAVSASCIVLVFSVLTILRNRDWHDDETLFRSSLAIAPKAVPLWNRLGFVHLQKNENSIAEQDFEKALRYWTDPRSDKEWFQHYEAELGIGIAMVRENKTEAGVQHLLQAVSVFPDGNEANAALGAIRVNQNNYAEGMPLLEKAIRLSAIDELSRDYMGVALLNQHQYQKAVRFFREALLLNPDYEPARQHLSIALNALGSKPLAPDE